MARFVLILTPYHHQYIPTYLTYIPKPALYLPGIYPIPLISYYLSHIPLLYQSTQPTPKAKAKAKSTSNHGRRPPHPQKPSRPRHQPQQHNPPNALPPTPIPLSLRLKRHQPLHHPNLRSKRFLLLPRPHSRRPRRQPRHNALPPRRRRKPLPLPRPPRRTLSALRSCSPRTCAGYADAACGEVEEGSLGY